MKFKKLTGMQKVRAILATLCTENLFACLLASSHAFMVA